MVAYVRMHNRPLAFWGMAYNIVSSSLYSCPCICRAKEVVDCGELHDYGVVSYKGSVTEEA